MQAQESTVWPETSTSLLVHTDRQLFHRTWFTKSEADANLYQIVVEGKLLIIFIYVDDLILVGDEQLIHSCKGIQNEGHGTPSLFPWIGNMAA